MMPSAPTRTKPDPPEPHPQPRVKWFCCPAGHRMGYVYRRSGVARLVLYSQAYAEPVIIGAQPVAELTGRALVFCTFPGCGEHRDWMEE